LADIIIDAMIGQNE